MSERTEMWIAERSEKFRKKRTKEPDKDSKMYFFDSQSLQLSLERNDVYWQESCPWIMDQLKQFLDLFERRATRIPAVIVIGLICGIIVSKAQVFEILNIVAFPVFISSLIGLPILIWKNSPESRTSARKILGLIGYFFVFSIPFGIGDSISEFVPIGNEREIRAEIAKQESAEAAKRNAEQAEKERFKKIEAQRIADKKAIEAEQKRVAAIEALKQYDLSMSVRQISNEFDRNSARAEDQLKGKRIRVTGYAGIIDDNPFNQKSILFQITDGEFLGGSVRCNIKRSDKSYQRFDKGQPMVMIGTLAGEELGVRFDDCYFP